MQLRAIPMDAHRGVVRSLAVAKAGNLAVTGGRDHLVCLWNLCSGGLAATLSGHGDWIADVAINSDGTVAASASYDHTVRLWDCSEYEALQVLDCFEARVRCIAFTPDGKMLLVGDEKGTLGFFVLGTAAPVRQPSFEGIVIDRIALDDSGRIAALSCEPGMVVGMRDDLERNKPGLGFVFWEDEFRGGEPLMELHAVSLPEGNGIRSFRLDDAGARSICFARGSAWLMAAQTDGRVRIYDFATGKPAGILGGHEKAVTSVRFAPGAKVAATASNDGTLRLWDFTREFDASAPRSHAASVSQAAVTPDASVGVSVSVGGELRFWSLKSGELSERQDLNEGLDQDSRLKSFAVAPRAPRGTLLAAANEISVLLYPFYNSDVSIVDIPLDSGDGILNVDLSPDGAAVGRVSDKGVVFLLDCTAQQVRRLVARDFTSKAVPVLSQNCIVTSYDDEPQVDLRDLNIGAVLFTMHPGKDVNVQTFEVTPNGTAVFISYDGGGVQLWSIQNRKRICELAGSGANVLAISAIAEASRAAIADTDRKISLWDMKDRRLLAKAAPIGRCFALAITRLADGILAGDTSGSICFLRHIGFD
jgi:WD40 repeat protein